MEELRDRDKDTKTNAPKKTRVTNKISLLDTGRDQPSLFSLACVRACIFRTDGWAIDTAHRTPRTVPLPQNSLAISPFCQPTLVLPGCPFLHNLHVPVWPFFSISCWRLICSKECLRTQTDRARYRRCRKPPVSPHFPTRALICLYCSLLLRPPGNPSDVDFLPHILTHTQTHTHIHTIPPSPSPNLSISFPARMCSSSLHLPFLSSRLGPESQMDHLDVFLFLVVHPRKKE